MLRFVGSQLRFRPLRAGLLVAAILVAAGSFVLLTAAARTTQIRVRGSVESSFRAAYDVLVRPPGSTTQLERAQGLVRPNYLSGIFGGISLEQYDRIRRLPGVEVAAPVANVGYVLISGAVAIPVDDVLTRDGVQLYRVQTSWIGQRGLSRYPGQSMYVYYTRRNVLTLDRSEVVPGRGLVPVCSGLASSVPPIYGPFERVPYIQCFSERSPGTAVANFPNPKAERAVASRIAAASEAYFPMLLTAIDPVQEERLLALDRTVVSGRYLRADEAPRIRRVGQNTYNRYVPVIASTRSFVDETVAGQVARLRLPRGVDLASALASGCPLRGMTSGCSDSERRKRLARGEVLAYDFLRSLRGRVVGRKRVEPTAAYEIALGGGRVEGVDEAGADAYWRPSDVRYRIVGVDRVAPISAPNPLSVYRNSFMRFANGGFWQMPQSNRDLQFRKLRQFVGSNLIESNVLNAPVLEVVGRFDPAKLPGFSPLSRVPLETYYPPLVEAGDAASRRALGGKPLLPSQNLGDYIQQPPLLLTTLQGLHAFTNTRFFEDASARAPISTIRIRVAGVRGPDELSMERIRTVATRIREETGLDVDITAGSSPHPILVDLPAGRFGRPELLLREGWSKKGVSVSFLQALDRKRLALLGLILVTSGFFLGNGAYAAVRARRREIGTLLTLGWSPRSIFAVVLGELLLLGLAAGLIGAVLAVSAAALLSLDLSLARALLVVPLAVALALAAGLVPAWRAARCIPLDAVRPVIAGRLHGRRVRRLLALALANVRRLPARSLVAASGLFVGVAVLTLLLAINRAFQGTLVGTLLGEAISLRVRGLDFLTVGLVIALAALSLADVLFLNLRERAPELVTLRTLGWSDAHLARLLAFEALTLGLVGSVSGAVAGVTLGAALGVSARPLALAAAVAAAGGTLVALAASLLPLSRIRALTPPAVLAEE